MQSCPLHVLVTAVLCNVSENEAVREALTQAGAAPILVRFLDLIDFPGSTSTRGRLTVSFLNRIPWCFEFFLYMSVLVHLPVISPSSDVRICADGR
jgi:hypothetical protein